MEPFAKNRTRKAPIKTSPYRQSGVSMLEVLVSIVIVSLGLLGYAGLQMVSLKSNNTAYYRSQATLLAYDMIDRMRVNRDLALAGSYNQTIDAGQSCPDVINAGDTVAEADVAEWKANVLCALPAARGEVEVVLGGATTVTLEWDEDGDGVYTSFSSVTRI